MPKPIFVLNGPNLNMLGVREPAVYGRETLADVRRRTEAHARRLGLGVDFRQTNRKASWSRGFRRRASRRTA